MSLFLQQLVDPQWMYTGFYHTLLSTIGNVKFYQSILHVYNTTFLTYNTTFTLLHLRLVRL